MKKIQLTLFAFCLFFAANTFAQDNPAARKGLFLSIGPEGAIPVGTFRNTWKFGVGGSAKLGIPVSDHSDFTINAGYIAFSKKSLNSITPATLNLIPFKGGYRWHSDAAGGGFYVEPQIGFTQSKESNLEGRGDFTYALNLGYLIANAVDISARYEALANSDNTSAKMIGIRLAYNFRFARAAK